MGHHLKSIPTKKRRLNEISLDEDKENLNTTNTNALKQPAKKRKANPEVATNQTELLTMHDSIK